MTQLPCFEELKELAIQDPEAFERLRQKSCHSYINSIPAHHRQRLRAVQFRVDQEIRKARTPMAGLVKVSGMMHDSFYLMAEKLEELSTLVGSPCDELKFSNNKTTQSGNVVSISNWKQSREMNHNVSEEDNRDS